MIRYQIRHLAGGRGWWGEGGLGRERRGQRLMEKRTRICQQEREGDEKVDGRKWE